MSIEQDALDVVRRLEYVTDDALARRSVCSRSHVLRKLVPAILPPSVVPACRMGHHSVITRARIPIYQPHHSSVSASTEVKHVSQLAANFTDQPACLAAQLFRSPVDILTFFLDGNVNEKVRKRKMLYFTTSRNYTVFQKSFHL